MKKMLKRCQICNWYKKSVCEGRTECRLFPHETAVIDDEQHKEKSYLSDYTHDFKITDKTPKKELLQICTKLGIEVKNPSKATKDEIKKAIENETSK